MTYKYLKVNIISFLLILICLTGISRDLKLPVIFSDNMVLQRNVPCKIWGWSNPNEKVELTIHNEQTYTYADSDGNWTAYLPPHKAGGPFTLEIKSDTTVQIKNVMYGEVWVASGQSNMEFRLKDISDGRYDEITVSATYPDIRYFKVPRGLSSVPEVDLEEGKWDLCNPETIQEFSAVSWFFMKKIHDDLNVPVAIIESSWGATPAEAWTSQKMLETLPFYRDEARNISSMTKLEWKQKYAEADSLESLKWSIVQSDKGYKNGCAKLDFDDSGWEITQLPKNDMSDVVWVRKVIEVDVRNQWKKQDKEFTLNVGQAYIFQDIFLNNKKLKYDDLRRIKVPASELKNGKNILAIRANSPWSNLVHIGVKDAMFLQNPDGDKINLEGEWKFNNKIEAPIPSVTLFHEEPVHIFNAMIHPIAGYTMKGAIWYQGESNREHPEEYYSLFTTMIQDWRTRWEQGNFPFLFVQLANYLYPKEEPQESQWAEVREAQRKALDFPNTGMAVAIDIGEARNIHPFNKKDVGERLYLNARKIAYGFKETICSGPQPFTWKIIGPEVIITFKNTAGALQTKDGRKPSGFALAGEDNKFYWADAQIKGDCIIVRSEKISSPNKVRYAWADNPECNLYNRSLLPASPFQIVLEYSKK